MIGCGDAGLVSGGVHFQGVLAVSTRLTPGRALVFRLALLVVQLALVFILLVRFEFRCFTVVGRKSLLIFESLVLHKGEVACNALTPFGISSIAAPREVVDLPAS